MGPIRNGVGALRLGNFIGRVDQTIGRIDN